MCTESATNKDVKNAVTSSLFGIARALSRAEAVVTQVGRTRNNSSLGVALFWNGRAMPTSSAGTGTTLAAAPSIVKNGFANEMRIPLLWPTSPSRARLSKCRAATSTHHHEIQMFARWSDSASVLDHGEVAGIYRKNSASIPVQKTDKWVTGRINLGEIKTWDKAKSIVKLKIEVVTPDNVKVATIDPNAKTSDSPQFVLNLLVFDRDSFSDTFER